MCRAFSTLAFLAGGLLGGFVFAEGGKRDLLHTAIVNLFTGVSEILLVHGWIGENFPRLVADIMAAVLT